MPSLSLIVLRTADLSSLVAFYKELGCVLIEEKHGAGPVHFAAKLGGSVLEIYPLRPGETASDTGTRLGFDVEDLDGTIARLKSQGRAILKEPERTPWGVVAVVRDTDGRSVQLTAGTSQIVGFGRPDHQEAFIHRNPKFVECLERLEKTCAKILLPQVTGDKMADGLIFFTSRLAAEEFHEILVLGANGYGKAGKRLLRGMYERLVASVYVEGREDQAGRFLHFGEIQRRKYSNHMKSILGVDVFAPKDAADLEVLYKNIKGQFEEQLCKKCGTTRPSMSWSQLDTLSMAKEVKLDHLYVDCYFEPTQQLHNTLLAISSRVKESGKGGLSFDEGSQPIDADKAIRLAHLLLALNLAHHSDHFKLGLDAEANERLEDYKKAWT